MNLATAPSKTPSRTGSGGGTFRDRLRAIRALLMPTTVGRYARVMAWISVVAQSGIVTTGGLVRLTGSGLGCPTWPMCTADSFVPTPEMGIHGIIEWGNRTLTGVVCIVALLTFLAVLRTAPSMRLARPALAIGLLTILQAIVGGLTVLLQLHPNAVGVHFLISALIVSIAALLLVRVYRAEPVPPVRVLPGTRGDRLAFAIAVATVAMTWVTVYVGSLTTGSGPHAGDAAAERNGLDPQFMQHAHSIPAYVLLGLAILLVIVTGVRAMPSARRAAIGFLALVVLQAVVGIWQSRTGLPIVLVSVHMTLSMVSIATVTVALVLVRRTASLRQAEVSDPERVEG